MKLFDFSIDTHQANWMFDPIRNKRAALSILLRTTKIMMAPTAVEDDQKVGSVTLAISKMSRLFFRSANKEFSLAFPFFTREIAGRLHFYSSLHPQIDSKCTSEILSLLEREELFDSPDVLAFADPICAASDIDVDIWKLFRELLLLEDGYVRYDDDPVNSNGHRHPRHHIDLFYSQGTTFKAGLRSGLTGAQLRDILNIETDCHYLQPTS